MAGSTLLLVGFTAALVLIAAASTEAQGTGNIAGRVTNATTGAPLSGVTVGVYGADTALLGSAVTASDGSYLTSVGFQAGSYYVGTLNSAGYVDEVYNNVVCLACLPTIGAPVTVTNGTITTGIDFALKVGGRISGAVTNAANAPLFGVNVWAYDSSGAFVGSTSTASNGSYLTSFALPAGSYYVRTFNSLGYVDEAYNNIVCLECTVTTGASITVTRGVTTNGVNFALDTGGRISGMLTEAATGAAIAGDIVTVYGSSGNTVAITVTASDGSYLTAALPTGSYFARTWSGFGYLNKLYDNISCAFGCTVTNGTPITTAPGAITPGINFGLTPGGSISGVLTNASTGAPLAGISVIVYTTSGMSVASISSASDGSYLISAALPAGSYYVRTSNSLGYADELYNDILCGSCDPTTGTPVHAAPGVTTTGVNFALNPGGGANDNFANRFTLTGNAVTTSGSNLGFSAEPGEPSDFVGSGRGTPSAWWTWTAPCSFAVTQPTSFIDTIGSTIDTVLGIFTGQSLAALTLVARDDNSGGGGTSRVPSAVPGPSTLNIVAGTVFQIRVQSGGPNTGSITLHINAGCASISGHVTSAATGAPVSGASVQVYNSSGTWLASVPTAADGSYLTSGLSAGSYYVRTSNSLGFVNKVFNNVTCVGCSGTTGTPVALTAGVTATGIDFALSVGGRISGVMTNAATGAPISGAIAQVYNSSGAFLTSFSAASDGSYLTSGLPAGFYYVRSGNSQGYVDEVYNNVTCLSCPVTTGTPIAVAVGVTTTGIDIALDASGRISGVLTSAATGAPIAGAFAQIYNSSGTFVTSIPTASQGSYLASGFPAGSYYVRTLNSLGYVDEVYNNVPCFSCTVTAGTPITVTGGVTTTGVDFALAAGGRISGVLANAATGAPISGAFAQVYNSSGTFLASFPTAANGSYLTAGLPVGSYYLRTSNSLGYVNEVFNDVTCNGCAGTTGTPIAVTAGTTTTGIDFGLLPAVNQAPTITGIGPRTTNTNAPTGAIAFTVGDAETAATSLTVSGRSSNTTLVADGNITVGGSGASRTVIVTPATNQSGATTITVTVSDGSLSTPSAFLLTVNGFVDDPLIAGASSIKAVHVTELRSRIDALRLRFGLPLFAWTDSSLTGEVAKAVHILELRTALQTAFVAAGRTPPSFTDQVDPRQTQIRATHIMELRAAVRGLEQFEP